MGGTLTKHCTILCISSASFSKSSQAMKKEIYQQPIAEIIRIDQPLNLLIEFSAEIGVDDWGEGGEG